VIGAGLADLAQNAYMTPRAWRLALIALAAFDTAFVLGYLFPVLHHPIALVALPLIGLALADRSLGWSRRRVVVGIGIGLVLAVPFVISPTYLGRLF
jgi:hypothetical protein